MAARRWGDRGRRGSAARVQASRCTGIGASPRSRRMLTSDETALSRRKSMHHFGRFRVATLAVGIVLSSSPVLGVPSSTGRAETAEPSTPTSPTAEELLATARSEYAKGNREAALRSLQACYEVSHSTNVLFNLAQLNRELSHCEAAIEYYQRYLDAAPDGKRAGDARRHADTLRQRCPPPRAPADTPEPKPKPSSEPLRLTAVLQPLGPQLPASRSVSRPNHWNTVAWLAVGTGAAAVATAVYFSVETRQDKHHFEQRRAEATTSPKPNKAAINGALDDFYRDRSFAYAFGAVGVLAVGAGIGVWVLGASKRSSETTVWSFALSPTLVAAELQLRF